MLKCSVKYIALAWLLLGCGYGAGAQAKQITLEEALELAREQSLDALDARNVFLSSYWRYRSYRAELLPGVVFEGTMPSLNRSLAPYQREDGAYGFVQNSALIEEATLAITQNIPFTGGSISLQSQLQRIDLLSGDKATSYLSVPLGVTLNQPLISSHELKWAMKIEPERYREAQQQYLLNMESVHIKVITYYFDLLLAAANRNIANLNLENAIRLLDIANGKKSVGLASDNELLQLQLGKINAEAETIAARQVYESKMLTLRNFLRKEGEDEIAPVAPQAYNISGISLSRVMELARANNPLTNTVRRKLLESRMKIDQAKADRGFRADVYVSLGYTGSNANLPDAYKSLENRQVMSLGVRIPILDWGKGKGNVKVAQSELEVAKGQMQQAELNFEQEVTLAVTQFHDQAMLETLARHADSTAQLRYEVAFQMFIMGKINVLDINSAQVERDNAKRKYINELYLSWLCYYNLRQITLFDFEKNQNILHKKVIIN